MQKFEEQTYKKGINKDFWKKIFKFAGNYKGKLLMIALYMLIIAGIDGFFPLLNRYAIDNFVANRTTEKIFLFTIIYIIAIIIHTITIKKMIYTAGVIEAGVCFDIRKDGFRHLQMLSFSYYDKTPIGWLMARMSSDVSKLGFILSWGLVDFAWGLFMMMIITIIMLALNVKLALLVLTVVPILVIISMYFQKKILKSHRDVRKTNSLITGALNEGIMGVKTTKVLVREQKNLEEFEVLTNTMKNKSVKTAIFSSLYMPCVLILGSIGTALALWVGGGQVINGVLTYGTLVAFINYSIELFNPIRNMAKIFTELQSSQAAAERIMSMLDTEPDIKDSEEVEMEFGNGINVDLKKWRKINGTIEFRNVSFYYNEEEPVLKDFSLKVNGGETIALVGETGSGKSTIVNLACRFYEPVKGSILIDGIDYTKMPMLWLHSNLGYVLQTPHLFSGTVRENIRYGNLEATDEEIENAAKLVKANLFIEKMENGYDTQVGESGNKLSTGEKQLISFARAIVADPSIFVLDEATSSVDTETEHTIQDAITNLLKGRTSFIVAHRLSTIRNADRILVIQEGTIIEDGNHSELIQKKGYYYDLYSGQYKKEKSEEILAARV